MSNNQAPRLPLTAGFGATREALWRAFGREPAVKAAWALTMLSEYRLVQLSRYSIRVASVGLESVPIEDRSAVKDEYLKNSIQQYLYTIENCSATRAVEEKLRKDRDPQLSVLSKMSDNLTFEELNVRSGIYMYLSGTPRENREWMEIDREFLGYEPRPPPKELEKEIMSLIYTARAHFFKFTEVPPNPPVRFPEPKRTFQTVESVADLLDKYVGPRTRMYEIVRYTLTQPRDVEIPSYAEIAEEAEDVLRTLAHLGAKVEYVLSSLILNGYRLDATAQLGLSDEEREHLERLLDAPFRRVALLVAYGKVGDLRKMIQKLNREAFGFSTAVPKAYVESRPDIRRVLG